MSSACLQTTLMHSKSLQTCSTYLVRQTYVISYYSAPDSRAEYCDDRVCLSVSVCLHASISPEIHVRSCFGTDSMDYPDYLPVLLSISVFFTS